MDAELEFAIQPSTTGKQLFDQVRQTIRVKTSVVVCLLSSCFWRFEYLYLHELNMLLILF